MTDRDARPARSGHETLFSVWGLGGLFTLGVAWTADQFLGGLAPHTGAHIAAPGNVWETVAYIAKLGFPPVVAAAALLSALWLWRRERRAAAAATTTAALVVIAFSARPFAVVDLIGWHQALSQTLNAGRTVATTAVAAVLGFVLVRERLVSDRLGAAIAIGFPMLIGFSRMALGVQTVAWILEQWAIGVLIGVGVVSAYLVAEGRVEDEVV